MAPPWSVVCLLDLIFAYLQRLTELKKTHPSTLTRQSKTAEAERAVSEDEPAEAEAGYTFDEVDGATTAGPAEPTIAESDPNMPSTSEGNVLNTAKKTGKKAGRPPGPTVRGAAPPAELLITSSSKPKRQPKKPSKFNDSVLIGGRKKRKTKSDADETPASGTQTPEPVEEISAGNENIASVRPAPAYRYVESNSRLYVCRCVVHVCIVIYG